MNQELLTPEDHIDNIKRALEQYDVFIRSGLQKINQPVNEDVCIDSVIVSKINFGGESRSMKAQDVETGTVHLLPYSQMEWISTAAV